MQRVFTFAVLSMMLLATGLAGGAAANEVEGPAGASLGVQTETGALQFELLDLRSGQVQDFTCQASHSASFRPIAFPVPGLTVGTWSFVASSECSQSMTFLFAAMSLSHDGIERGESENSCFNCPQIRAPGSISCFACRGVWESESTHIFRAPPGHEFRTTTDDRCRVDPDDRRELSCELRDITFLA